MYTYLPDSNNRSFLNNFSGTNGHFGGSDTFWINIHHMLIHCTNMLQIQLADASIHTSWNNIEDPSFVAEAGGLARNNPPRS